MSNSFDSPDDEPLFIAIADDDPRMVAAYSLAARTVDRFLVAVTRTGDHFCCAKLKFRDPDLSDSLGEDRFVYLWLSGVVYHAAERLFSGEFFEVPPELAQWHHVGRRLTFSAEDIFDWFVLDDGELDGGFTMRVARDSLPEAERASYDSYVGARSYAPIPDGA